MSGIFRFRIAAKDSVSSQVQTLTISVGNVNHPPDLSFSAANPGPAFRVTEGKTLTLKIVATDLDSNDVATLSRLGTLSWPNCGNGNFDTATGDFTFTPLFSCVAGGESTFADIQFQARDRGTPPQTSQIPGLITVVDSNSAPRWKNPSTNFEGKEGKLISVPLDSLYLGDREGDSVTFTSSLGTVTRTPLLWSWAPGMQDSGHKQVTLTATDNHRVPMASQFLINLIVADSIRALDVIINSPLNGYVTRDTVIPVKWSVNTKVQSYLTTERLLKEGPNGIMRPYHDSLGNFGADSITVILDRVPPGSPSIQVIGLTNNPKPRWTWKSGGNGMILFRYKRDTANLTTDTLGLKDTSFTPTTNLSNGRHVLYVQERDSAGNWSAKDSGVVRIDLIKPVVKITSPMDSLVTNQATVDLKWTVDNGSVFTASKTLTEGANILFTPFAIDSAGNKDSTFITVTRRSNTLFVNA